MKSLVKIRILHPVHKFDVIENIDLDAIRVRRLAIQSGDYRKVLNLLVEVIPKDTRKLLLLCSEMVIYNKTDRSVELKIYD